MPTLRQFKFLPLSVRVETAGAVATPLVLRGTPLPATRSQVFSTAADNQSTVEVALWVGEAPLTRNNIKVGTFQLSGIPASKAGVPQIRIQFSVATDCVIKARATLDGSKLTAQESFPPPLELTDPAIQKVVGDAEAAREADETLLRNVETRDRANRLLAKAEERLAAGDNPKLSAAIAELGLGLASDDVTVIREKSDALNTLLSLNDPFDIFSAVFGGVPARSQPAVATHARKGDRPKPAMSEKVVVAAPSHTLGKIFGGATFTRDPQLCFVLMPFTDEFQPLYEDHIRPTVEAADLRCERADEIHGTGLITWGGKKSTAPVF